ncbi:PREDICTED: synaptojanin-1-like [Rhagoletis zephyria]|uniref:synaptojanin-1-like n=1 Tax=Rhagoletis zephyria TaxID=28612 RepID=UPI000811352F|nr:PREDICTED: synaptojanin-1-like [Rhagoletis zephyria]
MPDSDLNPTPAVTGKPVFRDENDLSIYLLTYNVARQSPAEDLTDLFDFQRVGAHDIYTDTVSTDLGLRKGGIGIRLYYNNISLAFVGAHLAAHEEHYQTRLKNYKEIIDQVHFSHRPKDGILDQDYAFFLGDLNFRINDLTSQQVYDAVLIAERKKDANKWIPLLQYDQLHVAQKSKAAFHHFTEANITFPPTYRFIISTDNYDWEKRKPAFTDRILYRNTLSDRVAKADQERVALRVLHYESIRQYCGSDHKPVRAIAHISASAFAEKIKWLQSRVKQRISKRDSPGLRAKTHRAPAVQGPAHGEGRSTDGVVADSPSSRSAPRSRHYYHEDPSLSLARQMTVQFEPIRDWTVESNHTIFFRVMDNRTNQTVGPDFPGLFQVLSNWDWIGLYREDFYSLDNYVTFAYPRFGETVEEAEDALALLHDETDEDQVDHLHTGSASQASTRRGSAASLLSSHSQSTSSAAYFSSNELGEGHPALRGAGTPETRSGAPSTSASHADLESVDIERVKSLDLGESSHSAPKPIDYVPVEEAEEDMEERKEASPVSSVSGSGDSTDSDHSTSTSSPKSASQSASSASSSTTTTTTTTTSSTSSNTPNTASDHEFSAMFDEQSFLFSTGRYVLIYRRKNGDVMGISEPFEIRAEVEGQEQQPPGENVSD